MTDTLPVSNGRVLLALIEDTFQEARARWLFWGLFALSTLLILLFLFVLKIDLVEGAVSLFGVESTTRMVDIHRFVITSYSWVSVILYIWGTLLAIFASSGLIPSVLEPGRISLLLSKPVTRPMSADRAIHRERADRRSEPRLPDLQYLACDRNEDRHLGRHDSCFRLRRVCLSSRYCFVLSFSWAWFRKAPLFR